MNALDTGSPSAEQRSHPVPRRATHTRFGALCGAAIGIACSATLLLLSREGGEAREGAALLAHVLSYPVAFLFEWADWGHWASQWIAFIAIAVPLNGLLLGSLAGAVGSFTTAPRWAVVGALVTVWMGTVAVVLVVVS